VFYVALCLYSSI